MVKPAEEEFMRPMQGDEPVHRGMDSNLCLEVAGFAAVDAVILTVLAESNIMLAHAQAAKAFTDTLFFGPVTQHANELFRHKPLRKRREVPAFYRTKRQERRLL